MDAATPQDVLEPQSGNTFAVLEDFLARFAPDSSTREAGRGRRTAAGVSALFSVMLHGAAALAFLSWAHNEQGVLETPTEAISLELLETEVLEQTQPEAQDPSKGSQASAAQKAGEEDDRPLTTLSEARPDSTTAEAVTEAPPALSPSPAPTEVVTPSEAVISGAAEVPDAPPPPQTQASEADTPAAAKREPQKQHVRPPEKKPEKRPQKTADKTETRASTKGGAPSRSSAASTPSAGKVSASAGDISAYAARVRARVASNRPSTRGGRGTAVVAFGVSRSGGLTYARLARSSGVPALDQAAVAAVRGAAPFPAPPAGVNASRLSFTFPFYFR